jgi:hypothetical protein
MLTIVTQLDNDGGVYVAIRQGILTDEQKLAIAQPLLTNSDYAVHFAEVEPGDIPRSSDSHGWVAGFAPDKLEKS